MKKGRILILSILVLMACGCDVKYDIYINNNQVSEKIEIPYMEEFSKVYDKSFYYDIKTFKEYDTKIKKGKFILTSKNIPFDNISTNFYFSNCFSRIESTETKKYYSLATSKNFSCMEYEQTEIDEIKIVLNTFNKVTEHNADETKFGKYIWYFDKYNYKNKSIYFSVKKNDYLWYYRYRGLILGLSGVLLVVIIGFIIYKIFKDKSNKENKI